MGAEGASFGCEFAAGGEGEYLKTTAVGKYRALPSYEAVDASGLANDAGSGAEVEMVCVAEDYSGVDFVQFAVEDAFNRAGGADWHKYGGRDFAVGGCNETGACLCAAVGANCFKFHFLHCLFWVVFVIFWVIFVSFERFFISFEVFFISFEEFFISFGEKFISFGEFFIIFNEKSIIFDEKIVLFETKIIIFETKFIILGEKIVIFDAQFVILKEKIIILGEKIVIFSKNLILFKDNFVDNCFPHLAVEFANEL